MKKIQKILKFSILNLLYLNEFNVAYAVQMDGSY